MANSSTLFSIISPVYDAFLESSTPRQTPEPRGTSQWRWRLTGLSRNSRAERKESVMKVNWVTTLSVLSASAFCIQLAAVPALAVDNANYTSEHHYYHKPVTIHDYMSDHPKVRSAAIGAGVGTAAGAI